MPSSDFFKELSEHLGAVQDMLLIPENAFTSRCFHIPVILDKTELIGYAELEYGEPREVYGIIEWTPNKRKMENLGWYNGEGDLPIIGKMRNADTIAPKDRLSVEINMLGRKQKILRELICTDIKILGKGSQAITYHLFTQLRQGEMSMAHLELAFITPLHRERVPAGIFTVQFTVSNQVLSKVELLVSRRVVKTFTQPPFECEVNLEGRSGFIPLVLRATDMNMHVVEESIVVEVVR